MLLSQRHQASPLCLAPCPGLPTSPEDGVTARASVGCPELRSGSVSLCAQLAWTWLMGQGPVSLTQICSELTRHSAATKLGENTGSEPSRAVLCRATEAPVLSVKAAVPCRAPTASTEKAPKKETPCFPFSFPANDLTVRSPTSFATDTLQTFTACFHHREARGRAICAR